MTLRRDFIPVDLPLGAPGMARLPPPSICGTPECSSKECDCRLCTPNTPCLGNVMSGRNFSIPSLLPRWRASRRPEIGDGQWAEQVQPGFVIPVRWWMQMSPDRRLLMVWILHNRRQTRGIQRYMRLLAPNSCLFWRNWTLGDTHRKPKQLGIPRSSGE